MTREEVAKRIRWSGIIWAIGLVNVVAMTPQLAQLIRTHKTDGLNVWTLVIYLVIQICFCLEGFFTRNKMLMWCLGLSAVVSAAVISLVVWFRHVM